MRLHKFINLVIFIITPSVASAIPLGSGIANPGYSAKQILMSDAASTSGLYWIDPDGAGATNPFQIFADMDTAGGGWTMGLNSLSSSWSDSTDMISNTGVLGLSSGFTRDMTALAIDQNAEIRHRIVDKNGIVALDAFYTGNYHGTLPGASNWTILEGALTDFSYHLGQSWSSFDHDVDSYGGGNCAVSYGVPWYYGSCWTSLPTHNSSSYTPGPYYGTSASRGAMGQWSMYVRETNTPAPLSPSSVPEPAAITLLGLGLVSIGFGRRKKQLTV